MIEKSTDWHKVHLDLRAKMYNFVHNDLKDRDVNTRQRLLVIQRDLQRMLVTIDHEVTELSKLEVEARRLKNSRISQTQLDKVNEMIKNFEQWFMIAVFSI